MARKGTILYVEDDEAEAYLFDVAVKKCCARFEVAKLTNIATAQKYLLGHGAYADRDLHPFPALVLSDYVLPGGTGQDLLQWIRQQADFSELVVTIMTSLPARPRIQQCYAHGLNFFLEKPAKFSSLLSLVECLDLCMEATPRCFDRLRDLPEYRPP